MSHTTSIGYIVTAFIPDYRQPSFSGNSFLLFYDR